MVMDESNERWLPYQIFFPIGVALGLIGVGYWPMYAFHIIETVPSVRHMDIQIHGFLFAFVVGFLMTALPRFSGTWSARAWEIIAALVVLLAGNLATLLGGLEAGRILFLLNLGLLLRFAIARFRKRKGNPPEEFVFVAVGILLGVTGAVFRGLSIMAPYSFLDLPGRRLLTEGMMTAFVFGIGGKLAPLFFGFVKFGPVPLTTMGVPKVSPRQKALAAVALLFAASFGIEYFYSPAIAIWLRALISTLLFAWVFRLYRLPETRGVIIWFLWISLWWAFLSGWGTVFHPQYRTPVLHILFIGGFGVLILCIATRVILAHGNYPMEIEKRSPSLLIGSIFVLTAMVLRAVSDLFPEHYFQLLGSAGLLWIIGLLVWGIAFSRLALSHPGSVSERPS
jgi:uncharacterized protein involved in response to NO